MTLVVITGGVRSGKSLAAQGLAASRVSDTRPVYVAAFARTSKDTELADRVSRHREDRDPRFVTVEAVDSTDWLARVPAEALLLVDCVGTLLGRVMEESWPEAGTTLGDAPADSLPAGYAEQVVSDFDTVLDSIVGREGDTIAVTNQVGDGVVPAWASARLFADVLGRANRRLVQEADSAYLCVCGRLIDLSSLPQTARWPGEEDCT